MGKTYKMVEVVGTSPNSFAEASSNAIKEAAKSIEAMGWFEVVQLSGRINGGKVAEFQSKVKIGFKLLTADELKK